MPMYAGFEEVRAKVAAAVALAGFEMCRLEVEIADSAWHLWLLDAVERADAVLVDLTDHNPFVMYELGYAHRRQLPTTFIVRAGEERVPATVRGAVCIPYGDGCEGFERTLVDELLQTRRAVAHRQRVVVSGSAAAAPSSPITDAEIHGLYLAAAALAEEIGRAIPRPFAAVDEHEFRARLTVAVRRGAPDPRTLPPGAATRALLSLFFEHSDRVDVMRTIGEWSVSLQAVEA
jgi:hypothetical protein